MKLKAILPLVVLLTVLIFHVKNQVHSKVYRGAYQYVCSLVEARFYIWSQDLEDWGARCQSRATDPSTNIPSSREFFRQVTAQLNEIDVSHLSVYGPVDEKLIWSGLGTDTGIRVRPIDGHLVVFKVMVGSIGEQAGLSPGDEILTINEKTITHMSQIETGSGWFQVLRGKARINFLLKPTELKVDLAPYSKRLNDKYGYLAITSFRAEYFVSKSWQTQVESLAEYEKLIIDLRGNYGGNFGAVVRALSPFFCSPQLIGELYQPRKDGFGKSLFVDTLESLEHLTQLESYSNLELKTYSNYGCFAGSVLVLIDEATSSVSEIFAEVIQSEQRGQVWGAASAGDVVVGVFYELPMLGKGFSVSIPEAVFRSSRGRVLEGEGVTPNRWLYYELAEALQGEDSWLLRALASDGKEPL